MICFILISLIPRTIGSDHVRAKLIALAGSKIGSNVKIKEGLVCQPLGKCHNLTIGPNTFVNTGFRVGAGAGVSIGQRCAIGPNVAIETANHSLEADDEGFRSTYFKPVVIEDNVWIGAGVTILPGVRIGKNSVIAAGAVVTKNVNEYTLAGGVPARTLKKINAK